MKSNCDCAREMIGGSDGPWRKPFEPTGVNTTPQLDWGTHMSVIQVGLTDRTHKLDPQLVQQAAAALNIQVLRDLPQYWNVHATVRYLPESTQIPAGVWPVYLVGKLPDGMGGVHLDKRNQPYALVESVPGDDGWTLDASHETLEMLVDPSGNRLRTSFAIGIDANGKIHDTSGQFEYLVEACDPCEGSQYAYSIQGIAVSDFITPHFYDPKPTSGTRYSFAGNIPGPRQVLKGGYISFVDPQGQEWEQILYLGDKPQLKKLGPVEGASLRAIIDGVTYGPVREFRKGNPNLENPNFGEWCKLHRKKIHGVTLGRGKSLDDELLAGGLGPHG